MNRELHRSRAVRPCRRRFVAFAGWRFCWFNYAPWRPSSHWNSSRAPSIARVTVCALWLCLLGRPTSCSTLSLSLALRHHHRLLNFSLYLFSLSTHRGREKETLDNESGTQLWMRCKLFEFILSFIGHYRFKAACSSFLADCCSYNIPHTYSIAWCFSTCAAK